MWTVYALLSAFFAALTSILAKIGLENIDSSLATAIRTSVILVFAWLFVFAFGKQEGIADLSYKNAVFLILSGLAAAASWLLYFKALQLGQAAKVMAIDKFSLALGIILAALILNESLTAKTIIAVALITIGTLILVV
ncbi:MAG: EamA family transporter [Elusimicrobiota bacterium]|jgi:transporter family protein|nr:EamA family transporter [Elusimicrobiota bacterium]